MTISFRDKEGKSTVVDTEYLEVKDIASGEIHDGVWIFKDYKGEE